jgi:hypothetical protein
LKRHIFISVFHCLLTFNDIKGWHPSGLLGLCREGIGHEHQRLRCFCYSVVRKLPFPREMCALKKIDDAQSWKIIGRVDLLGSPERHSPRKSNRTFLDSSVSTGPVQRPTSRVGVVHCAATIRSCTCNKGRSFKAESTPLYGDRVFPHNKLVSHLAAWIGG